MSTTNGARAQRQAELRAVLAAPTAQQQAAAELQRLDAEEAAEREAIGRAAAAERLTGIARAYGSLVSEFDGDDERVRQAHEALCIAVARLNDRFRRCVGLRTEAEALSDRFALPAPTLPPVAVPIQRHLDLTPPALAAHGYVQLLTEEDDTGLGRTRRTYGEIAGTEGFAIIAAAGPPAWPPLTERQEQILADRETQRERERRAARRFAAAAVGEVAASARREVGPRARG
jgi:hypothetical protein